MEIGKEPHDGFNTISQAIKSLNYRIENSKISRYLPCPTEVSPTDSMALESPIISCKTAISCL